jgi:hypothetical protein
MTGMGHGIAIDGSERQLWVDSGLAGGYQMSDFDNWGRQEEPDKLLLLLTISAGKSAQHVLKHPRNIVLVVIVG